MQNRYQKDIDAIYKSNDIPNRPIHIHKHKEGDPVISVVVPVYNAEKYLHECLNSIINQSVTVPMEIITVYDKSRDDSLLILMGYERNGLIKIFHSDTSGPSRARNIGIENSKGKYLIFVDADDFLTSNTYIEELYEKIEATGADIVQSGYIKTDGKQTLSSFVPLYEEVSGFQSLRNNIPGFSWGKIMRAELFHGISYPADYWFEDSIFHFIILRRCKKAAFIKTKGYAYRRNLEGITYSKDRSRRSVEAVTVIPKILEMIRDTGEPVDQDLTETTLEHAGLLLENRIRKLSLKEQKAAFLYLSEVVRTLPPLSQNRIYEILIQKKFMLWKLYCLKARIRKH